MKILIVHYNPGAPGQGAGGAESAVVDQKAALEARGHEVRVAYHHPERAYASFRPDITHFHTIHVGLGLQVLLWAQQHGIPHCLSLHDYWPFCTGRMLLARHDQPCAAVRGLCDGKCDSGPSEPRVRAIVNRSPVVTFNPYSAEIYRRHGVRVDVVIPHAIDTERFRPDLSARETGSIVSMSAWPNAPTKGIHVWRAALERAGLRGRIITGVPRELVPAALQRADIFVFPSCYEETWGLCLTEAMACGAACIASDVCGPRAQIEHGVTGLLVPPRDVGALADAMTTLLADGGRRREMGDRARAWVENHCALDRMAQDYEAFYMRIAGGDDGP